MRYSILLVIPILLFASCKQSPEKMITKKWQLRAIYTESVQSAIDKQTHYIDTLGLHNTPEQNALLGITDLNAYKARLRSEVDTYKARQQRIIDQTSYEFKPNGVVTIYSANGNDDAAWHFEGDKKLVIVRKKENRTTQSTVDLLTKDSLKLTLVKDGMPSTAIFTPAKS